ncbi:hypothetical protein [Acetobacter persici]|uniref:hypothetical protein n=1 Tax=Acetobacter persici TaxID=1076596 RepID=UPI0012FD9175|nr:hypothetical protein [Acetobacter persici]
MTHTFNDTHDRARALAAWEEALSEEGCERGQNDANLSPSQDNFVTLSTRIPLSRLSVSERMDTASWEQWFQNEILMHKKDGCGREEHFLRMLASETVDEEVVVGCYSATSSETSDQVSFHLWDGWHRTACSAIRRETSIPALLVITPQLLPQILKDLGLQHDLEWQPEIESLAP